MVEHIGNGIVKVGVKQKDLEDSINGLQKTKPIFQSILRRINYENQGESDAEELGIHIDTAIDAMTMLLSGFPDYKN